LSDGGGVCDVAQAFSEEGGTPARALGLGKKKNAWVEIEIHEAAIASSSHLRALGYFVEADPGACRR
jgi:hypothetical protein